MLYYVRSKSERFVYCKQYLAYVCANEPSMTNGAKGYCFKISFIKQIYVDALTEDPSV